MAYKANIEVEKNERETNQSLVRRFTKRLKSSGVINAAKSAQFRKDEKSPGLKKRKALRRIAKQQEYEQRKKLGKI